MTTLQEHEYLKPVRTKELKDMTPDEYRKWSSAMSDWLWKRDGLIAAEAVKDMVSPMQVRDGIMRERACLPRADYEWRDIPARKPKVKPAWSGSSKHYNAAAKERSRIKQAVTLSIDEMRERQERARASRAKYREKKRREKEAA